MVTLKNMGPKISEAELADLETQFGFQLPVDYKRFLFDYNGGRPNQNVIDIPGFSESPTDVQVFLGIRRPFESSCIDWNLKTFSERIGLGFLPIALDSGGNLFCLFLRSPDQGAVFYFDLESVFAKNDAVPECYLVAPNFDDFCKNLRLLENDK
jgi:hypothetical protein